MNEVWIITASALAGLGASLGTVWAAQRRKRRRVDAARRTQAQAAREAHRARLVRKPEPNALLLWPSILVWEQASERGDATWR